MMRGSAVGLWLVFVTAAACGDDTAGDGGTGSGTGTSTGIGSTGGSDTGGVDGDVPGDPASPRAAIEELVAARCDWIFGCCDAGEAALEVGPFTTDAQDCVQRVADALEAGNPAPPVTAGPTDLFLLLAYSHAAQRVELDPTAVAACADAIRAVPCNEPPPSADPDDAFCTPDMGPGLEACALELMAVGLVGPDEACEPTLAVECADGLACQPLGQSGVCVPQSEVGDFCFSDLDCTQPHYCDLKTGLCAKAAAEGEDCAYENPDQPEPGTETIRCLEGLACDPVANVCVGDCSTGSPCTGEADCPMEHDCVFARCIKPLEAGEPCLVGGDCLSGYCDGGTCAAQAANGEFCIPHSQCQSGFCHPFSNTCEPQQGDGQPCTSFSDAECADGVCDNSDPMAPVCVAWVPEGGACTNTPECSPQGDLACIDNTCLALPLPNGASCVNGPQCESQLCWENLCDDPSGPGDTCSTVFDPLIKPCSTDAYCDAPPSEVMGTCALKHDAGTACTRDEECWGTCQVQWGQLLCDDTPAAGEAWCDGM